MSDAARLASQAFAGKPNGVPYANFSATAIELQSIAAQIPTAIVDTAYSALISYAEAIAGIQNGSSSWSIVRLYYSSYYCLKALMLSGSVIPFHAGSEMIFDVVANKFLKGGGSSHHWNWHSLRQTSFKNGWYSSQDSQDAYGKLRSYRENVNYTHAFTDPNLHVCLVSDNSDISKKFRSYRDDDNFLYTYLIDHLSIAYPTRLIFELDAVFDNLNYRLDSERSQHVRTIWKIRDRCPLIR